jgi:hypothetical protein
MLSSIDHAVNKNLTIRKYASYREKDPSNVVKNTTTTTEIRSRQLCFPYPGVGVVVIIGMI